MFAPNELAKRRLIAACRKAGKDWWSDLTAEQRKAHIETWIGNNPHIIELGQAMSKAIQQLCDKTEVV